LNRRTPASIPARGSLDAPTTSPWPPWAAEVALDRIPELLAETESSFIFETGSVSVAAGRRVEQARDESVHPVLDCGQVVGRGAAPRLDLGECHREASVGTRQARGRDGLSLRECLLVAPQLCSRLRARRL